MSNINNKMIAIAAVAVVLVAGVAAVLILNNNDNPERGPMTDMRGRSVDVPDNIDSIMGFSSCSLELISFFKMVDKVTHVDKNENFETADRTHSFVMKNKLQNLPKLDQESFEAVAASGVDIIIMSTIAVEKLDNYQEKYGIPVFAINADLEFGAEYDEQLKKLGILFGEEQRAKELVDGIDALISGIVDNVTGSTTKVYSCAMNFQGSGSIPFLKTSGDFLPFTYSKVTNIMPSSATPPGKQPYVISLEYFLANSPAPDYIFADGAGSDSVKTYIKDNAALLDGVKAIDDGKVYKTLVYKSWGTNWQNVLINSYYIASILHADVFTWHFEDKANEILQLFYPGTTVKYANIASATSGGGCGIINLN